MSTRPRALAAALVCTAPLSLPSLARADDMAKVEIKLTPVAGNVFLLQGQGGNMAALVDPEGVALVDDEFAPLEPKIRAALATVSPKPVRFLINTHWHGDHTGGNALFSSTASIVAHANVRKRLAEGIPDLLGRKIDPAPAAALPVVTFDEGLTLYWGGDEVKVIHLGPGHTDGDSAVWFTKAGVVHLGDDFTTMGFPFIDRASGGSVHGLIHALRAMLHRLPPETKVIPGHGNLSSIEELKARVATIEAVVEQIEAAAKKGEGPEQITKGVLARWESLNGGFIKADAFVDTVLKDQPKK